MAEYVASAYPKLGLVQIEYKYTRKGSWGYLILGECFLTFEIIARKLTLVFLIGLVAAIVIGIANAAWDIRLLNLNMILVIYFFVFHNFLPSDVERTKEALSQFEVVLNMILATSALCIVALTGNISASMAFLLTLTSIYSISCISSQVRPLL